MHLVIASRVNLVKFRLDGALEPFLKCTMELQFANFVVQAVPHHFFVTCRELAEAMLKSA